MKEDVMNHREQLPITQSGAPVASCDLDETCADLDCGAVLDEFGDSLLESNEGLEFLSHYCGLDYMEKFSDHGEIEK